MNANRHPWLLTGPWYRWPQPGVPASGRSAPPVIQKYAAPDFVDAFLAEPQRSLKYTDKDYVHEVVQNGSKFLLSKKVYRKAEPECRKLFLDVHSRFYLVVCELRCDAAGLPSVDREKTCEAGFVIRRRRTEVAPEVTAEVATLLERTAGNRARIRELRRLRPGARVAGGVEESPKALLAEALRGECGTKLGRLIRAQARDLERLEEIAAESGVIRASQGWQPGEHPGIGAWVDVDETPQELDEEVLPLYPLIPDPAEPDHSAAGKTLFFGVVPTMSSDVDELGNPRYDDRALYELRCFVRRHKDPCPRTAERGDCPGELAWSAASEKYRLAAPGDLDGTSNRPITIQMPDLEALEAQASSLPPGEAAGVRMLTPPASSLPFTMSGDDLSTVSGGAPGGAQICFFAIPLITIVASFVLRLFLPIVVFLFGLWFLLRLKLCIPPSLSFDADVNLDLEIAGELGVAIEAELDIDASLELGGVTMDQLDAALAATFEASLGAKVAGELLAEYPLTVAEPQRTQNRNVLSKLVLDLGADVRDQAPPDLAEHFDPVPPGPPATLPPVTAGLEYYEILEVPA